VENPYGHHPRGPIRPLPSARKERTISLAANSETRPALDVDPATFTLELPSGRSVVGYRLAPPGATASELSELARLEDAVRLAVTSRRPLVLVVPEATEPLRSSPASLAALGRAARALVDASGVVPTVACVLGPLVSAASLLLGLVDVVCMGPRSLAYVSGPAMVRRFTGVGVDRSTLGGLGTHRRLSGTAHLEASDEEEAARVIDELLDFLPPHTDELPPRAGNANPPAQLAEALSGVIPAHSTGSYDVRAIIAAIADSGELLELRSAWAPQMVTGLIRLDGRPTGVVANQPRTMAGTIDIAASQKAASFVRFLDAFNLPILTFVDTPGFLPGKDLEWRGMIRHGAELVYAYAEATVPRICVILRKAFGGAYIVMDSKAMGNDLVLAWPSAEIAVMGARGAVSILSRGVSEEDRARLEAEYEERFLTPWVAAERGLVDRVIDPRDTRREIAAGLDLLETKSERIPRRLHGNTPL
jgi:acetyl-CoA carboxylase carboxyltransferase component